MKGREGRAKISGSSRKVPSLTDRNHRNCVCLPKKFVRRDLYSTPRRGLEINRERLVCTILERTQTSTVLRVDFIAVLEAQCSISQGLVRESTRALTRGAGHTKQSIRATKKLVHCSERDSFYPMDRSSPGFAVRKSQSTSHH